MKAHHIQRIIEKREELRWSQAKLAQELQLLGYNISDAAISNLERGERRINPDDLVYFAAALGVDPNWLVKWESLPKR